MKYSQEQIGEILEPIVKVSRIHCKKTKGSDCTKADVMKVNKSLMSAIRKTIKLSGISTLTEEKGGKK